MALFGVHSSDRQAFSTKELTNTFRLSFMVQSICMGLSIGLGLLIFSINVPGLYAAVLKYISSINNRCTHIVARVKGVVLQNPPCSCSVDRPEDLHEAKAQAMATLRKLGLGHCGGGGVPVRARASGFTGLLGNLTVRFNIYKHEKTFQL